jgi:hypothetical protein
LIADWCIIDSSDKEIDMRGSIRMIVGLVVVMGAVGGLDNTLDSQVAQLISCMALAVAGLGLMYSGVSAMNAR